MIVDLLIVSVAGLCAIIFIHFWGTEKFPFTSRKSGKERKDNV